MTRATKSIFVIAFLLALCAGVAVGMLTARTAGRTDGPGKPSSWLVDQLHLTADQQKQMDLIWDSMIRSKGRGYGEEFRQLQLQREAAISELMDVGQKARYDQINQEFAQKTQDVWKRLEHDFNEATERTRKILDASQQAKFDELIAQFQARRAPGGESFGGGAMPPGPFGPAPSGGSTQPAQLEHD